MINYLVDDNKIKKEIVLFKKPIDNKFYFSFVHEGLSPVKQAGGYALQNQQGETVFFLPPPTVADAGGKSGAVSLEINGDTAILSVEQTIDEDTATIGLNSGWNQILVKIAHGTSPGNRFNLKIADSDGGEIPGLTYQLNDPFPTIFFEDNFNQESSIPVSRWATSDTVNSRVNLSHLESSTWFMTKDPMATADYRYALDAIFNPASESTISASLMFRSTDENNGYGLALSDSGVNFFKKVNGGSNPIGPSVPFKLDPGKKYHIQIEARGNTFTAAIDNVSLLRVTDSDNTFAAPGKIGVYQDGLISFYDNVKVTASKPDPFVIKGTVTDQGQAPVAGVDIEASTYPDSNANIEEYASLTASDGSNGRLLYGSDVAIDSHDNVYVINYGYNWTTGQDESQILKFGPSGNFITKWGSYGSGDGQFDWPSDIAVDSNNHKYVTDGNNNRVEVFDANNNFLYSFGDTGDNQLYGPMGIVIGK